MIVNYPCGKSCTTVVLKTQIRVSPSQRASEGELFKHRNYLTQNSAHLLTLITYKVGQLIIGWFSLAKLYNEKILQLYFYPD